MHTLDYTSIKNGLILIAHIHNERKKKECVLIKGNYRKSIHLLKVDCDFK